MSDLLYKVNKFVEDSKKLITTEKTKVGDNTITKYGADMNKTYASKYFMTQNEMWDLKYPDATDIKYTIDNGTTVYSIQSYVKDGDTIVGLNLQTKDGEVDIEYKNETVLHFQNMIFQGNCRMAARIKDQTTVEDETTDKVGGSNPIDGSIELKIDNATNLVAYDTTFNIIELTNSCYIPLKVNATVFDDNGDKIDTATVHIVAYNNSDNVSYSTDRFKINAGTETISSIELNCDLSASKKFVWEALDSAGNKHSVNIVCPNTILLTTPTAGITDIYIVPKAGSLRAFNYLPIQSFNSMVIDNTASFEDNSVVPTLGKVQQLVDEFKPQQDDSTLKIYEKAIDSVSSGMAYIEFLKTKTGEETEDTVVSRGLLNFSATGLYASCVCKYYTDVDKMEIKGLAADTSIKIVQIDNVKVGINNFVSTFDVKEDAFTVYIEFNSKPTINGDYFLFTDIVCNYGDSFIYCEQLMASGQNKPPRITINSFESGIVKISDKDMDGIEIAVGSDATDSSINIQIANIVNDDKVVFVVSYNHNGVDKVSVEQITSIDSALKSNELASIDGLYIASHVKDNLLYVLIKEHQDSGAATITSSTDSTDVYKVHIYNMGSTEKEVEGVITYKIEEVCTYEVNNDQFDDYELGVHDFAINKDGVIAYAADSDIVIDDERTFYIPFASPADITSRKLFYDTENNLFVITDQEQVVVDRNFGKTTLPDTFAGTISFSSNGMYVFVLLGRDLKCFHKNYLYKCLTSQIISDNVPAGEVNKYHDF